MALSRVKVTSKRQITLPVAVCKAMGLEQGDELEVLPAQSGILLRRAPGFPRTTAESSIFRSLGSVAGPRGPGAEIHHELSRLFIIT